MEKPETINLAMKLLWGSLAVGLIPFFLRAPQLGGPVAIITVVVILAITLGILAALYMQINAGKNWARTTLAVFYVLGLLPFIGQVIMNPAMQTPVALGVNIIQLGAQGYAIYLMYTSPGQSWFVKRDQVTTPVER